jgi:hypothetical protein
MNRKVAQMPQEHESDVSDPLDEWVELARRDTEPWPSGRTEQDTIQPLSWENGDAKLWALYRRSIADHYDLFNDVDWDALDPDAFTPEQRIGIAYWFAIDATFEQAGTVVFARALIGSYEARENEALRRMLLSITRDEGNHDLIGKLVCERLLPGFPYAYKPETELEWAAMRNVAWCQESVNRFWHGYKSAYAKYRFPVLLSSFASGEAVGTLTYGNLSKQSSQPIFRQLTGYMAKDESRHFQTAAYFIRRYMPQMREDEIATAIKNLGASYAYFSLFMASEPNPAFWNHLPPSWARWHERLEDHARSAGLAIASPSVKNDYWREGLLRVKSITDAQGVEFLAIPELGIDGRNSPISADDILVVGF